MKRKERANGYVTLIAESGKAIFDKRNGLSYPMVTVKAEEEGYYEEREAS